MPCADILSYIFDALQNLETGNADYCLTTNYTGPLPPDHVQHMQRIDTVLKKVAQRHLKLESELQNYQSWAQQSQQWNHKHAPSLDSWSERPDESLPNTPEDSLFGDEQLAMERLRGESLFDKKAHSTHIVECIYRNLYKREP